MESLEFRARSPDDIMSFLYEISRSEPSPSSGRMFTHSYESGDETLRNIARKAFELYMEKTMLDFTAYPSIIRLEKDVVSFAIKLMGGTGGEAGTFTHGGTESIMLAVKAARDFFKSKRGDLVPEIILPYTAHPAFIKSAIYLGLKPVLVPVDSETFKVDLNAVLENINENTAVIVGSAPNYPFGVVDDIRGLSDIALDHKLWLHVDACIGGFTLPFFRELGELISDFDFRLKGVHSISLDLHKYGYAPRGASLVLYRDRSLRRYQFFIYSKWPGYPLVNTVILSTRSAGPLAASWAVINYLGKEGYLRLSSKILNAKRKIVKGIKEIGLKVLGNPGSSIIAFTEEGLNITQLSIELKKRGWTVQVQPGSTHLGFPPSIHMAISPVHDSLAEEFLADLERAVNETRKSTYKVDARKLEVILGAIHDPRALVEKLGIGGEKIVEDETLMLINEAIRMLPPEMVDEVLLWAVNELVY